jgi:hypothetical protein
MTRFELMTPYKGALRRISAYLCCRPGEAATVLCSSLASQYWMLAGAGRKLDGPGGALRVTGLAGIYAKVFQVWLDDPVAVARQDHGRSRQTAHQRRALAVGPGDGMRGLLPLRLRVPAARLETTRD